MCSWTPGKPYTLNPIQHKPYISRSNVDPTPLQCVCVCACVCVCVCVCVRARSSVCVRARLSVCVRQWLRQCACLCSFVRACAFWLGWIGFSVRGQGLQGGGLSFGVAGGCGDGERHECLPNPPPPYPLKPKSWTLNSKPCTLHSTPLAPDSEPEILHPAPYTLNPTLYTSNPEPYTHSRRRVFFFITLGPELSDTQVYEP